MSTPSTIRFGEIERMLKHCAPNGRWELKTHSRSFRWNGRFYRSFPKYDEIHLVHIRKLMRTLLLDEECVYRHLPELRPKSKKADA